MWVSDRRVKVSNFCLLFAKLKLGNMKTVVFPFPILTFEKLEIGKQLFSYFFCFQFSKQRIGKQSFPHLLSVLVRMGQWINGRGLDFLPRNKSVLGQNLAAPQHWSDYCSVDVITVLLWELRQYSTYNISTFERPTPYRSLGYRAPPRVYVPSLK